MNLDRRLIANLAVRSSAALLSFAAQIALVKLLGVTGYGGYVLFATTCSLIFIFASGGLDVLLLKAISVSHAQRNKKFFIAAAKTAVGMGLILSVVSVLIVQLARELPILRGRADLAGLDARWLLPGVVCVTLLAMVVAIVKGMQRFITADAADSIVKPIAIIVTLTLLASAPLSTPDSNSYIAYIGGHALAVVFCWLVIRRLYVNTAWQGELPARAPKLIGLNDSVVLTCYALVSYAFFQLDTLLVGFSKGQNEVAGYNMACNFVRLVIFFPMIVAARSQPSIAVHFNNREYPQILLLVKSNLRLAVSVAAAAALALVVGGENLLRLVNGEFAMAYPALSILAIAHVFNSAALMLTSALLMCGLQKIVLHAQICGLLVCLPLYYFLIPRFAATGAAVAVAFGLGINLLCLAWLVGRLIRRTTMHEIRLPKA